LPADAWSTASTIKKQMTLAKMALNHPTENGFDLDCMFSSGCS